MGKESSNKFSRKDALLNSYVIDSNCCPNIAYKGPRFNPTHFFIINSENEELLEQQISAAQEKIKGLEGKVKSASECIKMADDSFNMIRNLFRKYPDAMEFLRGPLSIILCQQEEFDDFLNPPTPETTTNEVK